MRGAQEFTMIGNVLMGIMAIAGFSAMLYAVGVSMTDTTRHGWKSVEPEIAEEGKIKKVA